jgi:hypothetical protein
MSQTHYQTLRVSEAATQDEIKRAYRYLAKKYHPDRNRKKGAEEKFKEIGLAYQVLGDLGRRQVYDYDLRQSRKAGASSGSSSAQASAPPPPPPPPKSPPGAKAQTPPPSPPPAQGAYRYLFFLRGVLVGGVAAGVLLVLGLVSYVACHGSRTQQSVTLPEPVSARAEEPPTIRVTPKPTPTIPEPTPVTPEPTPTWPEPPPVTPEPTLTLTSEPTPPAPELTPVPPPIHLCGEWRGSIEWFGTRVPFVMRLEQHGNEITGFATETHNHRVWRSTINGRVTGSTVTLTKNCERNDCSMTLVSSDSSSAILRGTWETPQSRGSWQVAWEGGLVERAAGQPRDDSLRSRPPSLRPGYSRRDCWYGLYRTPDGSRARCAGPSFRSSP